MKINNLHPLQSPRWGEFREKTGIKVVNEKGLQITIHPIPYTRFNIGYFPKGLNINQNMLNELLEIGKRENCIFIQIEPNVEKSSTNVYKFKNLFPSSHPLFTKYDFILDLTKSEDELIKDMHSKTRYNLRLAQKKGVKVVEDNSDVAFGQYLKLNRETTERQKFYAHSEKYHKLMWDTLRPKLNETVDKNKLTAHLLKATYKGETLVTWIVFVLENTLYYPYGGSSDKYREVMASNLMMWEAIKFGKNLGLEKFDMWGALGPNPDSKDSWYGFHKFKQGYGGKLIEFVGSYDFVINKNLYFIYKILNKIRWVILRFK